MAPVIYDIKYYKGDSYSLLVWPKTLAATPFDLTGFSATFDIADKRGSAATQKWRLIPVVSVSENNVLCTITPTLGAQLDPLVTYVYDITVSNGTGAVHTFVTGTVTVADSVEGV